MSILCSFLIYLFWGEIYVKKPQLFKASNSETFSTFIMLCNCLHFWKVVLMDIRFSVDKFFLSALWIRHCIVFWPPLSLMLLGVNFIEISIYIMNHFSLVAFKVFSWSFFFFSIFTTMHLGVGLFIFFLLGFYCISSMCRLIFFIRVETFLAINFLNIFSKKTFTCWNFHLPYDWCLGGGKRTQSSWLTFLAKRFWNTELEWTRNVGSLSVFG